MAVVTAHGQGNVSNTQGPAVLLSRKEESKDCAECPGREQGRCLNLPEWNRVGCGVGMPSQAAVPGQAMSRRIRGSSPSTGLKQSSHHSPGCAQPILQPQPFQLEPRALLPPPYPCCPLWSIIYLAGAGHTAGQMCWEQLGHPEGTLPSDSGGISRAKAVTARRVCTVNHGLIKPLSL